MKNIFNILIILSILIFSGCNSKKEKDISLSNVDLEKQMIEAYNNGLKALEEGDVLFAAKKFNEAEVLFPQSKWAPRAALMAAYSYYTQDYYLDAIAELDRFLIVYPNYKDMDYVYYLMGLSYYEQIVDETKDLESIIKAKEYFELLIKNYPNTEYSIDAKFKKDYIEDILASKEMYVGRYYVQRKKWIPAINRFRSVIDNYDTTIYTEEALYRLVEINYKIGLKSEAEKYAKLLGYNYQSSKWYEQSYILFNKSYEKSKRNKIKKAKKKNKSLIKKIKSLINLNE